MKKPKKFPTITWLPEDSEKAMALNAIVAKYWAEAGHPEAKEFLSNLKVKHLIALETEVNNLVARAEASCTEDCGSCHDDLMLAAWLRLAGLETLTCAVDYYHAKHR